MTITLNYLPTELTTRFLLEHYDHRKLSEMQMALSKQFDTNKKTRPLVCKEFTMSFIACGRPVGA